MNKKFYLVAFLALLGLQPVNAQLHANQHVGG